MREEIDNFKPGQYVIYVNGDRFEIGKIKRVTESGAFVWYHEGDTAANTPFDCLYKLENAYVILKDSLGALGMHSEVEVE